MVTNLPVKRDLICADLQIQPDMLREFPAESVAAEPDKIFEAAPNGCVLVLDEVWRLFPAGLKVNKVPEAYKTVFAEHRHRVDSAGQAMQIVLVTQDLAQISSFARQLVETTFRTTQLTSIGMRSRFRVDVFAGPVSGPNPNPSSALRQIPGRYRKEIYRYYTSHTQSESETEGADERAVDRRANVLLRPMMLAAPFLVVGLVWFGVSRLWHEKSSMSHHGIDSATAGGRSPNPSVNESTGRYVAGAGRGRGGRSVKEDLADDSGVQVLFLVETAGVPGLSKVYIADGARVVEWPGRECLRRGRSLECLYKGDYYDSVGFVRPGPKASVSTWSSGQSPAAGAVEAPALLSGAPGVQGAGARPPGAVGRRDGRHNSS